MDGATAAQHTIIIQMVKRWNDVYTGESYECPSVVGICINKTSDHLSE